MLSSLRETRRGATLHHPFVTPRKFQAPNSRGSAVPCALMSKLGFFATWLAALDELARGEVSLACQATTWDAARQLLIGEGRSLAVSVSGPEAATNKLQLKPSGAPSWQRLISTDCNADF